MRVLHDLEHSAAVRVPASFPGLNAEPPSHEIADGDEPHVRRGCPFQAWTVGEVIRMLKFAPSGA